MVMSIPDFWPAAAVVPALCVGFVFRALSHLCCTGILVSGRTVHIAIGTLISAVVLTAGLFWLAKPFLAIGASIAFAISRAAGLWWVHRESRKDYDMGLQWWPLWATFGVGIVAYGLSLAVSDDLVTALGAKTAICIGAAAIIFFSPITGATERAAVTHLARSIVDRVEESLVGIYRRR